MSLADLVAHLNIQYSGPCAAAILHNVSANTFHPIIFRDSPLPGGTDTLRRIKSIGHHTTGFPTLAEAAENIEQDTRMSGAIKDTTNLIEWSGDGIPALVAFIDGDRLILF